MKNKKIVWFTVICLVIAGLSFRGGMIYAGKNIKAAAASRQNSFAQNGGARGGAGMRAGANSGFVSGEVLSKDNQSVTIKLNNGGPTGTSGGSKIVLISPSTQVEKTVSGAIFDVAIGSQVSITGIANSDGSVSANSIQIRPASATPAKQ